MLRERARTFDFFCSSDLSRDGGRGRARGHQRTCITNGSTFGRKKRRPASSSPASQGNGLVESCTGELPALRCGKIEKVIEVARLARERAGRGLEGLKIGRAQVDGY